MKKLVVAAMLLGAAGISQAAGSASAGQAKAAVCSACHGFDGRGITPMWPNIGSQHEQYLAKQLSDFKSGARKDDTMTGMAAPLSDQDVADLAAWYGSQSSGVGSADPEKAAPGEAIYRAGVAESGVAACMACHGPTGMGNPMANFPSLAGQQTMYTIKQLKDFRDGTRTNDAAKMMQMVADKMTDAEIEAVAEYIAGLH